MADPKINQDHDLARRPRGNRDIEQTGEAETHGSGASADDVEEGCDPHQEDLLDEGVEETFPASDPVAVKDIS